MEFLSSQHVEFSSVPFYNNKKNIDNKNVNYVGHCNENALFDGPPYLTYKYNHYRYFNEYKISNCQIKCAAYAKKFPVYKFCDISETCIFIQENTVSLSVWVCLIP